MPELPRISDVRMLATAIASVCIASFGFCWTSSSDAGDQSIKLAQATAESMDVIVREEMIKYIEAAREANQRVIITADRALNNFAERVQGATLQDASNLTVLKKIGVTVFDVAWDDALEGVPGASQIKAVRKVVQSVVKALDDQSNAKQINRDRRVVDWIADQRTIINDAQNKFKAIQLENELFAEFKSTPVANKGVLAANLGLQRAMLEELAPRVEPAEKKYYEEWINAHFRGIAADGTGKDGFIQVHIKFDSEGPVLQRAIVISPNGRSIAEGFNKLQKVMPGFKRFLQIKVRKQVCMFDPNLSPGPMGLGVTPFLSSCGWLDENNKTLKEPQLSKAKREFNHQSWRAVFGTFMSG